jgi:hypothetical protein
VRYATRSPGYPLHESVGLVKLELLCALVIALLLLLASAPALPQQRLSAADAKDHVGETATVCGKVASTRYAASTRGQPTFLNLDKPYPNQIFTVLIWGSNRSKFGAPEIDYQGESRMRDWKDYRLSRQTRDRRKRSATIKSRAKQMTSELAPDISQVCMEPCLRNRSIDGVPALESGGATIGEATQKQSNGSLDFDGRAHVEFSLIPHREGRAFRHWLNELEDK